MLRTIAISGIFSVLALALAILPSTAQATLSERDLFAASDTLLTFDSDTGLEWLDLTETLGLNYDDAEASSFVVSLGFRHATIDEVSILYTNAGISDQSGSFNVVNLAGVTLLIDLVGCTRNCSTDFNTQQGGSTLVPPDADFNSVSTLQILDLGNGLTARALIPQGPIASDGIGSSSAGQFLVREASSVPEPGTLALFAIGLAGLGYARRRNMAAKV